MASLAQARVLLFDDKCRPIYDLGAGPYNTVSWNPFGRFLLVAGFGNLPGEGGQLGGMAAGADALQLRLNSRSPNSNPLNCTNCP